MADELPLPLIEKTSENQSSAEEEEKMTLAEFLETVPPGKELFVADLFTKQVYHGEVSISHSEPDIQVHCSSDKCNGKRFFTGEATYTHDLGKNLVGLFYTYTCRNCRDSLRIYSVLSDKPNYGKKGGGKVIKVGEYPVFGPPLPSRVIKMAGPHRELLIKGRRSENQGLGVGAFAYYRQVVEDQKSRIIRQIAEVARKTGAPPEEVEKLEQAANEEQFRKAVDEIRDGLPRSLFMDGHNPLTLLHSALSKGLHAGTDEECLEIATSIRVILSELSERISEALKDEAELKAAVSRLLQT